MTSAKSRRHFLINLCALSATSVLPTRTLANRFGAPFETSLTPAASDIRVGYASITWNGDDLQAIKDISELGFGGIQLRSNLLKEYGDKPKAIKEILQQHKLQFVALSGGG